jgi:hypothetical protein
MTGSITWCLPQVDGRFNVRETWVDDDGTEYVSDYFSDVIVTDAVNDPTDSIAEALQDEADAAQAEIDYLSDSDAVQATIDSLTAVQMVASTKLLAMGDKVNPGLGKSQQIGA